MDLVDSQVNFNPEHRPRGRGLDRQLRGWLRASEPRSGSDDRGGELGSGGGQGPVASEGHLIGAQGQLQRSRYSARSRPSSPAEGSGSGDLE
jgi:hypothetical protein